MRALLSNKDAVFGQYGAGTFSAPDELFEHHIAVLADLAGL
ncbi:hypothetical protein [Arthrobacter ipis]|nr:hypothetical protein [Arthrobacter ipis]